MQLINGSASAVTRPQRLSAMAAVCLAILTGLWPPSAEAATIVIANRSAVLVEFTARPSAKAQQYKLPAGELIALRVDSATTIRCAGPQGREYLLEPNSAHFFHRTNGSLELEGIGFGNDDSPATSAGTSQETATATSNKPLTIAVRLLVDEEERAARPRWEERLRKRLAAASDILRQHCGVSFAAAGVGTWNSDNQINDFEQSLREFETRVPPGDARLVIGFTSQYQLQQGRVHLGGTHGPLATHILMREWSQHVSEPERLEMLIHELGHFLGASHSPEAESVMRPVLADRKALSRSFRIGFDPLNTLAMNLVVEGLQQNPALAVRELPATNRRVLERIYGTLAHAEPDDPVSTQLLSLVADRSRTSALENVPKDQPTPQSNTPLVPKPGLVSESLSNPRLPRLTTVGPVLEATRAVLAEIVESAAENARRPAGRVAAGEDLFRREGDVLTEHFVRRAAVAVSRLGGDVRRQAFFLALAVATDTGSLLREHPLTGDLMLQLESEQARARRLAVIGVPTIRGRYDLVQHFFVSAAIAAVAGPGVSESAGIAKELGDSQSGSGFSFTDLCADLAGIAWAEHILADSVTLADVARNFTVARYVPSLNGLQDGLTREQFVETFGSVGDPRFQTVVREIQQSVSRLYDRNSLPTGPR